VELTQEEGRVLGCLVEKQLTTPQQYPLTENALLAACNQSTSRDPVVAYDTTAVRLAVRSLREQGLLRTVHRSGERSEKHRHLLDEGLGLSTPQQVLLALLLLRGPQTAAELRARAERMHAFGSIEDVEDELMELGNRSEPLVTLLARQPGQKESRYAQLLATGGTATGTPSGTPMPAPTTHAPPAAPAIHEEVAALRDEVAALRAEVDELRARVDAG
jgi:uncharacterized protein YceH (UPF0502 family)